MSLIYSYAKNPAQSSNLEDFMTTGRLITLKYSKFCLKDSFESGNVLPIYNVLDSYRDELISCAREFNINDITIPKYKFNPKRLAYDYYGTTDLFFIILYVNGLASAKEFTLANNKVKLIEKDNVAEILGTILGAEEANIKKFNSKIT